jgi:hypothetical protein
MSKMTSIYKCEQHGNVITDLSVARTPRFYWNYDNDSEEDHKSIYSFMMEILRMTVIPRMLRTPKP